MRDLVLNRRFGRGTTIATFLLHRKVGRGIRRLSDHISRAGAVRFYTLAIFVVDKRPGQKETAPAGARLRPHWGLLWGCRGMPGTIQ